MVMNFWCFVVVMLILIVFMAFGVVVGDYVDRDVETEEMKDRIRHLEYQLDNMYLKKKKKH